MKVSQTLHNLLEGIGECLNDMTIEELITFSEHWQVLKNYVSLEDSEYNSFLFRLKAIIVESPTLITNGFDDVLSSIPRYKPQSITVSNPTPNQLLPPIHNEVIKIGNLINQILAKKNNF